MLALTTPTLMPLLFWGNRSLLCKKLMHQFGTLDAQADPRAALLAWL